MYALIYNPLRCNDEKCREIASLLDSMNIELRTYPMTGKDDRDGIRKTCEGCERVIIAGGDGTMHKVINATRGMGLVYAIVPIGSGNDLARAIGVYGCKLKDCIVGDTVDVDSWIVNDEILFLSATAFGVPVIINTSSKTIMKKYSENNLRNVIMYKPVDMKVSCDGKSLDGKYSLLNMQNIDTIGGGMTICKEAKFDDGLINVIVGRKASVPRLALNLLSTKRGGLSTQPNTKTMTCKEVEIEVNSRDCMIDGEVYPITKMKIRYAGTIKFIGRQK